MTIDDCLFAGVAALYQLKITLQQAAGDLPRKEFESIYNSLAKPPASCGECARYTVQKH